MMPGNSLTLGVITATSSRRRRRPAWHPLYTMSVSPGRVTASLIRDL